MRQLNALIVCFGLLLLVSCSQTVVKPTAPMTFQGSSESSSVDLGSSFIIRNEQGARLSHAPALVLTEDGKQLVVATANNEVILFEAASRDIVRRFVLPAGKAPAIALDSSGRYAAWTAKDASTGVLDTRSGEILVQ